VFSFFLDKFKKTQFTVSPLCLQWFELCDGGCSTYYQQTPDTLRTIYCTGCGNDTFHHGCVDKDCEKESSYCEFCGKQLLALRSLSNDDVDDDDDDKGKKI
jgi:hypothetical protein